MSFTENRELIGTFVVKEVERFRNHYETACNYDDVEVQAGEYPALAEVKPRHGDEVDVVDRIHVTLPGVIVDGFILNRILWETSAHVGQNNGREATHHLTMYAHTVAYSLLRQDGSYPHSSRLRLIPEIQVDIHEYEWEGETKYAPRLIRRVVEPHTLVGCGCPACRLERNRKRYATLKDEGRIL